MKRLDGIRWLIRQIADQCSEPEEQVERAFHELIKRGHLRVLPGKGPGGTDGLEMVIKEGGPFARERWWLQ